MRWWWIWWWWLPIYSSLMCRLNWPPFVPIVFHWALQKVANFQLWKKAISKRASKSIRKKYHNCIVWSMNMANMAFMAFLTHHLRGLRAIRAWDMRYKRSICDKCGLNWKIARTFFLSLSLSQSLAIAIIFEFYHSFLMSPCPEPQPVCMKI